MKLGWCTANAADDSKKRQRSYQEKRSKKK